MGSGLEPMMQTATPPRIVHGDFPHLCPGDACAVCHFVSKRRLERVRDAAYRAVDKLDIPDARATLNRAMARTA